jgi:hypothetical protein
MEALRRIGRALISTVAQADAAWTRLRLPQGMRVRAFPSGVPTPPGPLVCGIGNLMTGTIIDTFCLLGPTSRAGARIRRNLGPILDPATLLRAPK